MTHCQSSRSPVGQFVHGLTAYCSVGYTASTPSVLPGRARELMHTACYWTMRSFYCNSSDPNNLRPSSEGKIHRQPAHCTTTVPDILPGSLLTLPTLRMVLISRVEVGELQCGGGRELAHLSPWSTGPECGGSLVLILTELSASPHPCLFLCVTPGCADILYDAKMQKNI